MSQNKGFILKVNNKLVENTDIFPIVCDNCYNKICKDEIYLCHTVITKDEDLEYAYCEKCVKDVLTEEEYKSLYQESTLPDDPEELCRLCLKFYNDGHYDNSPCTKPLYDMLKKLYTILSQSKNKKQV